MVFLSQLLGSIVRGKSNEEIGRLEDLIVRIDESVYPTITGLVVRDHRRRFFVHGANIADIDRCARLSSSVVDLQAFRRRDGEVLLGKDVLDHQIIDITGRRIVRVNDIKIGKFEDSFRVVGVDVSPQALLRRLGPRRIADRIVGRQLINWADLQYLASAAPVRLRLSYDRLGDLNPVDLARIVDALSYRESVEIVSALDDESAAEVLEEVSDDRVADLLERMDQERAADILEEMAPGAAADALEDLSDEVAEQLLARMEPDEAADVQAQLAYDEHSVGRIMSTDFVRVDPSWTVGEAVASVRAYEEPPDPLLALYAVVPAETDASTRDRATGVILHGIIRLRGLILHPEDTALSEIMDRTPPTVRPDDRAEEAARVLAEYNLLAVPVVDDHEHMIGIVTFDDAMAILLPEIWQRRGVNAFA